MSFTSVFNYRMFYNYYFIGRGYLHECITEKKNTSYVWSQRSPWQINGRDNGNAGELRFLYRFFSRTCHNI